MKEPSPQSFPLVPPWRGAQKAQSCGTFGKLLPNAEWTWACTEFLRRSEAELIAENAATLEL